NSNPTVSADGNKVAFLSGARLVAADTNVFDDVYVRDITAGTTTLVSVPNAGGLANGPTSEPRISSTGRYVVFSSAATNLVAADTNLFTDVFVKRLSNGAIARVSVPLNGLDANNSSSSPTLSSDARYVGYVSQAFNLIPNGDTNGQPDIFVKDTVTGQVSR